MGTYIIFEWKLQVKRKKSGKQRQNIFIINKKIRVAVKACNNIRNTAEKIVIKEMIEAGQSNFFLIYFSIKVCK